jgi:hypothetical protein
VFTCFILVIEQVLNIFETKIGDLQNYKLDAHIEGTDNVWE